MAIATIPVFSDRPVAMLVETEARGSAGDDTVVAITVQAAPEDRRRLGRDVWIQVELKRGGQRVDRLARPADLDDQGRATIEVTWPPGDYRLHVEIEGAGKGVTGVWVGPITVPATGSAPSPEEPTPAPTPVPTPVPAAGVVIAGAATGAAAAAAGQPEIRTPAPEVPTPSPEVQSPEPRPDEPTAAAAAVPIAATVADPKSARPEPSTPSAEPRPDEPTAAAAAAPIAATAADAESARPKPPTPKPESRIPSPEPPTPSPEPQTRSSSWPADDTTTDLTVMVTERNRPVLGLQTASFSLRVGGKAVTIEEAGAASAAPLNLGFAVSIAASTPDQADDVGRVIARFAHLTTGDDGASLLAPAATATPVWLEDVDQLIESFSATKTLTDSDPPQLITTALGAFEGRRGRSVLVVVTDGEVGAARDDWKAVWAAADGAGVPIFVIGLRDSGFPSKTRNTLAKLADSTGGRSYFLGDAGMLQMTLDYIADLIEGSYALRFSDPSPASGTPRAVKAEVGTKAWKVHAPSKIR